MSKTEIPPPTRPCQHCGNPVPKPTRGPWGKFCPDASVEPGTTPCRIAHHHEITRLKRLEARKDRVCEICKEPIPPVRDGNAKRCQSPTCTAKAQYEAVRGDPVRQARARKSARAAQRKRHRSMSDVERAVWSLRRRAETGAKRVHDEGGIVEDVDLLRDVIDRDRLRCGVCGGRVRLALGRTGGKVDPLAVSIDHVVPIERGGSHTADNLAVVHWGCNSVKQNRTLEWAREHATRQDAPTPTVADLYVFYGAFALTSNGQAILLEEPKQEPGLVARLWAVFVAAELAHDAEVPSG